MEGYLSICLSAHFKLRIVGWILLKFDVNIMPLEATPNLYVLTVLMVTMIIIVTVLTTVMIVTKTALVMNFYALGNVHIFQHKFFWKGICVIQPTIFLKVSMVYM
jgi:hypothetical protein